MNIVISIVCTECGRSIKAPITKDEEGKYYLSGSIEEQQEGFYCNLNQQYAMKINCNCGNDITLYY